MKPTAFNTGWTVCGDGVEKTEVTLPHDAMIHRRREAGSAAGSAQGFFPGGAYVYEKTFTAPPEWLTQHVAFQFEGVYKNAQVFFNGKAAGGVPYGYSPFFVCADGLLQAGENIIRVTCDNTLQPDSRWYSGAGIYRPVWLWVGQTAHIEPEGIKINTLSYAPARIRVEVVHTGGESAGVLVEILDGDTVLAAGAPGEFELPGAQPWSEDTPRLYTCRVTLKQKGTVCDTAQARFGVRKVEWSAKGLFINGKSTLLRGGCLHHDHGILGAAAYEESEYRRVKKLKAAGYNAIRSSHNPASRAMLEACDALGVYLIDETWDMWFHHKNKYDYATDWRAHHLEDLNALVSRDFNHPSVIFYSIGNEVSEPAKEEGLRVTREMTDCLHRLDPSRAVTGGFNLMIISSAKKGKGIYEEEGGRSDDSDKKVGGMNSTLFNFVTSMVGTGMNKSANSKAADEATAACLDTLDIAGYNYASGRYPMEGKKHPERVIFGSETFPQDIAKNWAMVKQYPYLIGDFMWTAWDYLGEAGIGAWAYTPDGKGFSKPYPWLLGDVGALDILGNANGELFLAQAAWGLLKAPAIAVQPVNHPGITPAKGSWRGTNALPSWAWQGCEGNRAVVEVYTDAPAVELLLNGKSLGKKKTKNCKASFKTKYAPGKLEAVAYGADGQPRGRGELSAATGKTGLCATPETIKARPGEICYIDVALVGENGVTESNADELLTATVSGGELLAFGSANPRTEERYDSGKFTTYYGRALAVVRAGPHGTLTLRVAGKGKAAEAQVPIQ